MASLKLAEILTEKQNLERILDSLSDGIIAHDKRRRLVFFNRAAENITGYSRKDILGKDCHEAFGSPFCGTRCSFQDGMPEPRAIENVSYPLNLIARNGEARRIEMTVSGMNDDRGELVGVLACFRDMTDLTGLRLQVGEITSFAGIIGNDPEMLKVYRRIRDLATNDYPVYISGETGTGKELVAAAIHSESRRGGGPFVPVNCAALPEGILESELFGHVKGAFTGAVRDKKGRFELAHEGTLFLDEVADLPKVVQAKLLRVIQEKSFERVGDEKTISVDVRFISASNRDLKREVEKGHFREDLYYRINVVPIRLPPLRERKRDIPPLVEHFLRQSLDEGPAKSRISREALDIMTNYPWPGNIRELQSAVRFALVKCKDRLIRPVDLPLDLRNWEKRPSRGPARKLRKDAVLKALAQTGDNKAKAARILGVSRATLYRFLADLPSVS